MGINNPLHQIYLAQLFQKVELMKKRIEQLRVNARNNEKVFIGMDPLCGENEVIFIHGNMEKIVLKEDALSCLEII